jgi:large subunit ribosomal protein L25
VAETYTLDAQPRAVVGKKVSQLRNAGVVPAVIYGPRQSPINVQIPYRALEIALMKAGGTHLIEMTVDGSKHTVLAREVQRDVLRGSILHVDFFAVSADTRITADVPVHFVGESPAVTARKGMLLTSANTLTIEVLPKDLISQIDVDISGLAELGDSIHVRDLTLNPDIQLKADPDDMLARIVALPTETEEVTAEAPTSAEPEVIQKGKQEEEDF